MRSIALTALGTVLGLQSLRAFLPLLVFGLRDRFGLSSVALGGVAFLLFSASFLLPRRAMRAGGRMLPVAALVLAASRGSMQLWSGDPLGSLALAAVGVLAFLALLIDGCRVPPGGRGADGPGPIVAVLLGALVDTALHAAVGTRDLHWGGTLPSVIALALVALTAGLALSALRLPRGTTTWAVRPAGLLAWGPFWLLHLELFANVARFSARTGLPTAYSGALVALGLALAVVAANGDASAGREQPARTRHVRLFAAALALILGLIGHEAGGWTALPLLVAAQVGAATLLARILAPAPTRPGGPGAVAYGAGMLLFLVGLFAHYAGYDLPLPVSRLTVLLAVAAVLIVAALAASGAASPSAAAAPPRRGLAMGAATIALLPLLHGVSPDGSATPAAGRSGTDGVRVVSFNLHNGFDERGAFAFDRMMDALREAAPDVVALQEVSRGWVIHGSADLFELARDALGLHAIPGPCVSSDWGNAILAKAPLTDRGTTALPPRDLPLPRAVTRADVSLPGGEPLTVLATHYHHREGDPEIRAEHSRFLVDHFPPTPRSVLLGDFNDDPDAESLRVLRDSGWVDVAESGTDAKATFPSGNPGRRIDTVFHGAGLSVRTAAVAPPWGSDHRAVVVDFEVRNDAPAGP